MNNPFEAFKKIGEHFKNAIEIDLNNHLRIPKNKPEKHGNLFKNFLLD